MTVQELINELERFDPGMEVRFAAQPNWPFEYSINSTVESNDIIYLEEGVQIGYLPSEAAEALGWR
mgnify:CR=1 FL=1